MISINELYSSKVYITIWKRIIILLINNTIKELIIRINLKTKNLYISILFWWLNLKSNFSLIYLAIQYNWILFNKIENLFFAIIAKNVFNLIFVFITKSLVILKLITKQNVLIILNMLLILWSFYLYTKSFSFSYIPISIILDSISYPCFH